jgi:hypothetical protein
MKPLHAAFVRLSKCPCCQSKYSKKNSGGNKNHGKTAAHMRAKREIAKEIRNVMGR